MRVSQIEVPWSRSPVELKKQYDGLYTVDGPGLYDTDLEYEVAFDWVLREIVDFTKWAESYQCSCGNNWPCWDSVAPGWNTDFHHRIDRALDN